jgi:hypothetical protein
VPARARSARACPAPSDHLSPVDDSLSPAIKQQQQMGSTWQANNASLNASSSRRQAATPGGSSRPTITLDDWESRTPLAEDQLASISHVRRARDQRPLPQKVRRFAQLICCCWTD